MFPSITKTEIEESTPRTSPPWVWVGFLFAGLLFICEVVFVFMDLEETNLTIAVTLIGLPGMIYWLFCIYRIHKILAELTNNRYPISPAEAAVKHLIPFYNIYWVFAWPAELSNFLNRRGRVSIISGYVIGTMLLLSLLARTIDGAIGMAFVFGVTMYVSSKVKQHVIAGRTVSQDQLPPLPDPRIFSQPIETTAVPTHEVTESPRFG